MVKSLKNTIKILEKTFLLHLSVSFIAGLFFFAIVCCIIFNESTFAALGSLTFACVYVTAGVLLGIDIFSNKFDLALKMGETRKNYLLNTIGLSVIVNFAVLILQRFLVDGEEWLYKMLFGITQRDPDLFFSLKIEPSLALIIVAGITILSMLFGFIISKFGRVGFVVVYLLFCFSPMVIGSIGSRFPEFSQKVFMFFIEGSILAKLVIIAAEIAGIVILYFFMSKKSVSN